MPPGNRREILDVGEQDADAAGLAAHHNLCLSLSRILLHRGLSAQIWILLELVPFMPDIDRISV